MFALTLPLVQTNTQLNLAEKNIFQADQYIHRLNDKRLGQIKQTKNDNCKNHVRTIFDFDLIHEFELLRGNLTLLKSVFTKRMILIKESLF